MGFHSFRELIIVLLCTCLQTIKISTADEDIQFKLHKLDCNNPCNQLDLTQHPCDMIFGIELIVNNRKNIGQCKPTVSQDDTGGYCDHCMYTGLVDYQNRKSIDFSSPRYSSNDTSLVFEENSGQTDSVYVYVYITRKQWYKEKLQDFLDENCDVYNNSTRIWGTHSLSYPYLGCNLSFYMNYTCSEYYYGEDCDVYCKPHNDSNGHYSCGVYGAKICMQGYSGDNCSEYDLCSISSSDTSSTCNSTDTGVQYLCSKGYTGKNCLVNIDECTSNPCVHGMCKDMIDYFMCECELGFSGILCDEDINDCINTTCHHGECIDGLNIYTCNCENGFTGAHCNASVDDCKTNMCVNGMCVDGHRNYTCLCNPGYTGSVCDTRIDFCFNNSCLNGKCIDAFYETIKTRESSYLCVCDLDFTGQFCDIEINNLTETVNIKSTVTKSYLSEVKSPETQKGSTFTEFPLTTQVSETVSSTLETSGSGRVTSTYITREKNSSDFEQSKDLENKKSVKYMYPLIAVAVVLVLVLGIVAVVVCYKRRKGRQPSMESNTNAEGNDLNDALDPRTSLDDLNRAIAERHYGYMSGDSGANFSRVYNSFIYTQDIDNGL